MKLAVMMLKLLHEQEEKKFKSLPKRNMMRFTTIYLHPLSQVSLSYCSYNSPPSPPLLSSPSDTQQLSKGTCST